MRTVVALVLICAIVSAEYVQPPEILPRLQSQRDTVSELQSQNEIGDKYGELELLGMLSRGDYLAAVRQAEISGICANQTLVTLESITGGTPWAKTSKYTFKRASSIP